MRPGYKFGAKLIGTLIAIAVLSLIVVILAPKIIYYVTARAVHAVADDGRAPHPSER